MPKATIIKLVPSIFMPVILRIVKRNFRARFELRIAQNENLSTQTAPYHHFNRFFVFISRIFSGKTAGSDARGTDKGSDRRSSLKRHGANEQRAIRAEFDAGRFINRRKRNAAENRKHETRSCQRFVSARHGRQSEFRQNSQYVAADGAAPRGKNSRRTRARRHAVLQ